MICFHGGIGHFDPQRWSGPETQRKFPNSSPSLPLVGPAGAHREVTGTGRPLPSSAGARVRGVPCERPSFSTEHTLELYDETVSTDGCAPEWCPRTGTEPSTRELLFMVPEEGHKSQRNPGGRLALPGGPGVLVSPGSTRSVSDWWEGSTRGQSSSKPLAPVGVSLPPGVGGSWQGLQEGPPRGAFNQ